MLLILKKYPWVCTLSLCVTLYQVWAIDMPVHFIKGLFLKSIVLLGQFTILCC